MSNRKLSKHMDEKTFTYSDTAKLKKLVNSFRTTTQFNIAAKLCQKILDPLCDYYIQLGFKINNAHYVRCSSGFRGHDLNEAVGGSETSDHCITNISVEGAAIDLNFTNLDPKQLFNDVFTGRIKQPNGQPLTQIIDQMIYEERHTKQGVQRWVHFGRRNNPRRKFMYSLDGKTYHTTTKPIK